MTRAMRFDLPQGTIVNLDDAVIRLDPGPHPFEQAEAAAIEANWRREVSEKPALFNGEVALLSELFLDATTLRGRCHIVRYATFMWWRRLRPHAAVAHAYAHAMPVCSDGALVAVRMAGHTVNAGQVYFAAGSFEPPDFRDGVADIAANMAREVREETGLALSSARPEPALQVLRMESGAVLFRRYRLGRSSKEVVEAIGRHVAACDDPEITEAVVIDRDGSAPEGLAPHMRPLVAWHFATPPAFD